MTFDTLSRLAKRWAPAVSVIAGAAAIWVLWERLHSDDIGAAFSQLRRFPLSTLLTALACSAGCYLLVGLYEGIAVRIASGRRAVVQPFVAATVANPIGHMVAFAVLSAAALRYRLYSVVGLTAPQIAAVVVLVAMPYLLSVGWLIDIALLAGTADAARALHVAPAILVVLGVIGLGKDVGWLWFVHKRREPIRIARWTLRVPTLSDTLVQTAFGLGGTLCTAGVLYAFMPAIPELSFPGFLVIYLTAMLVAQVSHVPAGLGVLEAGLLLMLPHVPPAQVISATLAYRVVFELLPLIAALVLLAAHEIAHHTRARASRRRPAQPAAARRTPESG